MATCVRSLVESHWHHDGDDWQLAEGQWHVHWDRWDNFDCDSHDASVGGDMHRLVIEFELEYWWSNDAVHCYYWSNQWMLEQADWFDRSDPSPSLPIILLGVLILPTLRSADWQWQVLLPQVEWQPGSIQDESEQKVVAKTSESVVETFGRWSPVMSVCLLSAFCSMWCPSRSVSAATESGRCRIAHVVSPWFVERWSRLSIAVLHEIVRRRRN